MSKKIKKHIVSPDAVYGSSVIARLTNQIMRRGKKSIARKIVYGTFDLIKEKTKKESDGSF